MLGTAAQRRGRQASMSYSRASFSLVGCGRHPPPMQVALAWLLRRSPNIMLIPGTSSVAHLRENLAAAGLDLLDDAMASLNNIEAGGGRA